MGSATSSGAGVQATVPLVENVRGTCSLWATYECAHALLSLGLFVEFRPSHGCGRAGLCSTAHRQGGCAVAPRIVVFDAKFVLVCSARSRAMPKNGARRNPNKDEKRGCSPRPACLVKTNRERERPGLRGALGFGLFLYRDQRMRGLQASKGQEGRYCHCARAPTSRASPCACSSGRCPLPPTRQ